MTDRQYASPLFKEVQYTSWLWIIYNEGKDTTGLYPGPLQGDVHNQVPTSGSLESTRGVLNRFQQWFGRPLYERVSIDSSGTSIMITAAGQYVCSVCYDIAGGWKTDLHHDGHWRKIERLVQVYLNDAEWTDTERPVTVFPNAEIQMKDFLILRDILAGASRQQIARAYGYSLYAITKRARVLETVLGVRLTRQRQYNMVPTSVGTAIRKYVQDICEDWIQILTLRQAVRRSHEDEIDHRDASDARAN